MDPSAIAVAVWTAGSRTLVTGTPAAPSNRAEAIAQAVWEYVTRTLTGGSHPGVGRRGSPVMTLGCG